MAFHSMAVCLQGWEVSVVYISNRSSRNCYEDNPCFRVLSLPRKRQSWLLTFWEEDESLGMRNLRIIPSCEAIFSSVMIPRATSPAWTDPKNVGTHQYSLVTQASKAACAPRPFSRLPRQWSQPGPDPI